MTNATDDLDRLDAAVFEVFRAMATDVSYVDSLAYKVIEAERMKAYHAAARLTGRSLQSLLIDEDFDPLPLSELYVNACERHRLIVEHRLDRYLDSRTFESDLAHSVTVASPNAPAGKSR